MGAVPEQQPPLSVVVVEAALLRHLLSSTRGRYSSRYATADSVRTRRLADRSEDPRPLQPRSSGTRGRARTDHASTSRPGDGVGILLWPGIRPEVDDLSAMVRPVPSGSIGLSSWTRPAPSVRGRAPRLFRHDSTPPPDSYRHPTPRGHRRRRWRRTLAPARAQRTRCSVRARRARPYRSVGPPPAKTWGARRAEARRGAPPRQQVLHLTSDGRRRLDAILFGRRARQRRHVAVVPGDVEYGD